MSIIFKIHILLTKAELCSSSARLLRDLPNSLRFRSACTSLRLRSNCNCNVNKEI